MHESVEIPGCVAAYAAKMRKTAAMLYEMAGTYPGDITGSISREAYAQTVMSDLIADANWQEIMGDYDDSLPQLIITVYDKDGNEIVS